MEKIITSGQDLGQLLVLFILVLIACILLILIVNIYSILGQLVAQEKGIAFQSPLKKVWSSLFGTGAVPLEKEQEIILHHDYDGIKELDNHLPPWWKNLFYGCIIFAIIYIGNYHFWHISPSQDEEYQLAMEEGKKEVEQYEAKMANAIDEKSVKLLVKDIKVVGKGKEIFTGKCAACHGQAGEGGVGPNLTDEFWLHGGTINDVFKTIKYGVPEKGMIAWKASLKPSDIQDVANYVLSIQGTNPANAKAPQGEKMSTKVDSTAIK